MQAEVLWLWGMFESFWVNGASVLILLLVRELGFLFSRSKRVCEADGVRNGCRQSVDAKSGVNSDATYRF